ncbi:MAG: small multi-drug export protein [Candidatus Woesearchaeota archaeon]
MNNAIYAIILSLLPVSELRGGIPYAISQGMNPFWAYFICVIPNILIIFPVFFFLDYLHHHFIKFSLYKKLFDIYLKRVQRKLEKMLHLWEYLILFLFVAIPMPGTGAYTGCLVAWLLKMRRVNSMIAIAVAVMVAGVIVTLASVGIFSLF